MKFFVNNKLFNIFKNFVVKHKTFLVLFLIFAVGAYFRFYNLNWDDGHFFHPDERNIANAVIRISLNDTNPHFFSYGGFSIYLYRFIGEIVYLKTGDISWIKDWDKINLIGRNVSAFVSSLSIVLIFLIAKILFKDKKVALLAAFFTAFTVALIQNAHFAVTESLLIFLVLLIYIISFKILDNPNYINFERLGIISGIAIATKITAVSFLLIPIMVYLIISFKELLKFLKYFFRDKVRSLKGIFCNNALQFWQQQFNFIRFLFFGFIFFFLLSPYSLLDYVNLRNSMDYELGVASGKFLVPYTLQFIKTVPFFFQIDNLLWMQGPFLKVFSLIAFFYMIFLIVTKRDVKLGSADTNTTLMT